jgi:hypothetical protein
MESAFRKIRLTIKITKMEVTGKIKVNPEQTN